MPRSNNVRKRTTKKSDEYNTGVFERRDSEKLTSKEESQVHSLGDGFVCDTDARGHATPRGRSPLEIVVDASEGFIPLWAYNETLHWRFRERSFEHFVNPEAAKEEVRNLFAEALLQWGIAAPIKFTEDTDVWDFEIVMRAADNCSPRGCVLASAFFPDGGRHQLDLYPRMFTQTREEQIETLIHEIGHIFGLRHFFAQISETAWPSEIFGVHNPFSIMNYGALSELTSDDKNDLRLLYQLVWSGELTHINGTPIRLVRPYSTLSERQTSFAAVEPFQVTTLVRTQSRSQYVIRS